MTNITTPLGKITARLINQFCEIAGMKRVDDWNWAYLSDEVECWHLNLNEHRRSNESNIIKTKIYIPIRSYNFEISLYKTEKILNKSQDFNSALVIEKALEFCKDKMFGLDGKPVYYPGQFDGNENGSVNYGKILMEIRKERGEIFQKEWYKRKMNPISFPKIDVKTF